MYRMFADLEKTFDCVNIQKFKSNIGKKSQKNVTNKYQKSE